MKGKRAVIVSAEFTSFVGRGPCSAAHLPPDALILGFGDIGEPAVSVLDLADLAGDASGELVLRDSTAPPHRGRAAGASLLNANEP